MKKRITIEFLGDDTDAVAAALIITDVCQALANAMNTNFLVSADAIDAVDPKAN